MPSDSHNNKNTTIVLLAGNLVDFEILRLVVGILRLLQRTRGCRTAAGRRQREIVQCSAGGGGGCVVVMGGLWRNSKWKTQCVNGDTNQAHAQGNLNEKQQ